MRPLLILGFLLVPALYAQTATVTLQNLTFTPADEAFRSFAGAAQVMAADATGNVLLVNPPPTFANRKVEVTATFSYSFSGFSNGAIFSCGFTASPFPDHPATAIVERIEEGQAAGSGTTTTSGTMFLTEGIGIDYDFTCGLGPVVGGERVAEDTLSVQQAYQPIDVLRIVSVNPSPTEPLTPGAEQTFTATVEYTRDVIRLGSQAMLVATDGAGTELVERNERHQNNSSMSASGDGQNLQTIELTLSGVVVPDDGVVSLHAEQITLNSFGEFAAAAYTTYNESAPVLYGGEATTDYSIWHIEVNQAVQDDDNLIPLVAHKPGVVRVFVRTPEFPPDHGDNPTIVPVKVTLRKDGREVSYQRSAFALLAGGDERPTAVRGTPLGLEIPLPPDLLDPGVLEIEATANIQGGAPFLPESHTGNNTKTETYELHSRDVLTVGYVAPRSLRRAASADLIGKLFPVSPTRGLEYISAGRYEGDGFERDFDAPQVILSAAMTTALGEYDLLVIWSSIGQSNPLFEQLAHAQTNGRVAFNVYAGSRGPDPGRLAAAVAQTLLRSPRDEPCRSADDADFPTTIGWDSSRSRPVNLKESKDLLIDCYRDGTLWVSPSRYARLFLRDFAPFPAALSPEGIAQSSGEALFVAGEVTKDGGATLRPALRAASNYQPELDAQGSHCVVAGGPAGLAHHCFTPDFSAGDTVPFVVMLPAFDLTTLSVERNGEVIVSADASANAPVIALTSPSAGAVLDAADPLTVSWDVSDADGDAVHVSLLVSGDGGATFQSLAANVEGGSFVVDLASIPGGDQVVIRAIASDGLLSSAVDVGPVTVNQAPALTITDEVDFGPAAAGVSRTFSIPFEAAGTGPLEVLSVTSDNQAFEPAGPASTVVLPGDEASLAVAVTPPSSGAHVATLTLETNAGPHDVQLSVQGLDPEQPILDVIAPEQGIDFPEVDAGAAGVTMLSLINRGGGALSYTVTVEGDGFSAIDGEGSLGASEQASAAIRFAPGAPGDYAGVARVTSDASGFAEIMVALSGRAVPAPSGPVISQGGIVDAASFSGTLTRGAIASLFGQNLASELAEATATPLPADLGGVQVLVEGVPAPLFFASPAQINFQMPFEAPLGGAVQVAVRSAGGDSPQASVALAPYAPGVFANPATGEPIITRADGSLIDAASPASPGDILIVYLTGIGDLTATPVTGDLASADPLSAATDAPAVTAAGAPAQVFFAGLTPGFVGLGQLNIQLPEALTASGPTVPLAISFPGGGTRTVQLPF